MTDFRPEEATDEQIEEARALDAEFEAERDPEAQEARVDATAGVVAMENAGAPSEEDVAALYTAVPMPEASKPPELPTEDVLVTEDDLAVPGGE